MPTSERDDANELERLAIEKMERVLGSDRARALFERLVTRPGRRLATPNDLLHLSEAMTALGGMEGAVGAMLGVAAVLRGADGA